MANLPALIGAATNALTQTGAKALTGATVPVVTSLIAPAVTQGISRATTPSVTTALRQLLPSGSGSAIDGVINKNTGIVLPNAEPISPSGVNSLSEALQAMRGSAIDVTPASTNAGLAETNSRELAKLNSGVANTGPFGGKYTELADTLSYYPSLYDYLDSQGKIKHGLDFSGEANNYGLNSVKIDELTPAQRQKVISTLQGEGYGPENGLNFVEENLIAPDQASLLDQTIPESSKRNISINQLLGTSEPVSVSMDRPQIVTAEATKVAPEAPKSFNVAQEDIAEQFGISGAGGAGKGGNGGNITVSPSDVNPEDYGFNVPLEKNAKGETVIKIGQKTGKTTWAQKSKNFDVRNWLDSMNASRPQYEDVFADKSQSIGGFYKNAAERGLANKLNPANIKEQVQAMLDVRNTPLVNAEKYATDAGMRVSLPDIELSQAQAQSLAMNGVDLQAIMTDGTATPLEAEQIYKVLRDDSVRLRNASDGASQERGRAMKDMAKQVSESINKTMDSLGLDYKDAVLEQAAAIGEDPRYLEKIAATPDFKFSDLRADMADLMSLKELSTNKMKAGKTFNFAGADTGIPNPLGAGMDKAKSAFYKKAAKIEEKFGTAGAGGAGKSGGGGGNPAGAGATAGAGEPGGAGGYVFEEAGAKPAASSLLGKAKKIAPYAAGLGIGLMMGGGKSSGSSEAESINQQMLSGSGATSQINDPYSTMTIDGYTYDQLEQGYLNALSAGDKVAAQQIASVIEMLENKIERAQKSSSGTSATLNAGENILRQLYSMYKSMGGAQGPVTGRVTEVANALSGGKYNTDIAAYNSTRALTSSLLARALGEKGTLSDTDRKYINDNLPTITDDAEAAEKKFAAIWQLLQAAK